MIHRYYSVYSDLVLVDLQGKVVATANPTYRHGLLGADLGSEPWVRAAAALTSGDEYTMDEVRRSSVHGDRQVLVYATGVHERGDSRGKLLGMLGVYFDWELQGSTIVETEAGLSSEAKDDITVMLLDGSGRVIASSDKERLFKPFPLRASSGRGSYLDDAGGLVSYAYTLGYQEYDGRNWCGVIVRHREG